MMLQIFIQEGTSRRRDRQTLENFYYEAIYTALQEVNFRDTTFLKLKQLKAKIVRLYHETHHHLFLDNDDQNKMEDEEPSLHHLLKRHKRQEYGMVNSVYDNDGNIQTTMFMKKKYDTIQVDSDSVNRMLQRSKEHIPQEANDALDAAITMDGLHIAVKQGKKHKALRCYEDASGAKLNIQKSKAMALVSWDISHTIMGIPYHTELRILGIKLTTTFQQFAINSWRTVIGKIRAQARDAYSRTLSLDQRVLYVHNYLLANAWYTAQILPPSSDCIRQLNTAMSWYMWQGDTFRVPLSTLYRRK